MNTAELLKEMLKIGAACWLIGYGWFQLDGMNNVNAMIMLSSMLLLTIGLAGSIIAAIIWVARHVRIVIK